MSRSIHTGDTTFFPGIEQIQYEGPGSDNPLAFKSYDPSRKIGAKTLEEHLRFAVCYWHTFCATGADPFGPGSRVNAWATASDPLARSTERMDAAFEFSTKLGVPFWCFHDFDMGWEGASVAGPIVRKTIEAYFELKSIDSE